MKLEVAFSIGFLIFFYQFFVGRRTLSGARSTERPLTRDFFLKLFSSFKNQKRKIILKKTFKLKVKVDVGCC